MQMPLSTGRLLKFVLMCNENDFFRAAISVIGALKNCPHDILEGFARLAVSSEAFNDPSKWSKTDVSDYLK